MWRYGWENKAPTGTDDCLVNWWMAARSGLNRRSKKALDSLILLICWFIWLERNARVFNRRLRTVLDVVSHLVQELDAWIAARYHSLLPLSQGVVSPQSVDVVD
jgi:hypothetical protein